MKVICELNLNEFVFWAGAKDNASRFNYQEKETLTEMFEDIYGEEGCTDTTINDIMWFEPEMLCEWLGLDFEEWLERD